VVSRVRRLIGQKKVGHAGTLDPMATGVLLVCLGQATRLIEYLVPGRKQYRATIRFGETTDTLDADGQLIDTHSTDHLNETLLRQLLPNFLGDIEQIPPLFSAIKKDGRPLYKLARAGQTVELTPRAITIDSLTWVDWEPPLLTLDIVCSAGTYIRSLARDLGEVANCGAHLTQLIRTASGSWSIDNAIPLNQLEAAQEQWGQHLYPLDAMITHLPQVTLTETKATDIYHGRQIELDPADIPVHRNNQTDETVLSAYTPNGNFLAILTPIPASDKLWKPKKVFSSGGS
ncbi:MAG: tRNA pseudouridine(55) synthase TruB, partial [Chloroflexota bacterium]